MSNPLSSDSSLTNLSAFDKKEKRMRNIGLFFTFLPIVFGIVWLYYTQNKVNEINKQYDVVKDRIELGKHQLDSLNILLAAQKKKTTEVSLEANGYNIQSNTELIARTEADSALNILMTQYKESINKNLTIQYFRKSVDDEKIWISLKELGYINLKDKRSTGNLDEIRTNGIFYGVHAHLIDIKILTLSLMRSGCHIQRLYGPTSTPDLVQIIATKRPGTSKSLTIKQVMDATDLKELEIGAQF